MVRLFARQSEWLYKTSPGNRGLSQPHINYLCREMEMGRFGPSNDAWLFDVLERMRNGHHRSLAQQATNTAQTYLMRRRVNEQECVHIDQGVKRSSNAQMGFVPGFNTDYGPVVRNEGSVIVAVASRGGQDQVRLGANEKSGLISLFRETFYFVNAHCTRKKARGLHHASAQAVFVRAYIAGCDPYKLKYALEYLSDGGVSVASGSVPSFAGVGSLQILNNYFAQSRHSGVEVYKATEFLLHSFLEGKNRKFALAKTELFPVDIPMAAASHREVLQTVLGYDTYLALIGWTRDAKDGDECRPLELAKQLCPAQLPGGDQAATATSISARFSRTFKQHDQIELPCGKLTPIMSKNNKKIGGYRFTKTDGTGSATAAVNPPASSGVRRTALFVN
jgi:hypothetical protein